MTEMQPPYRRPAGPRDPIRPAPRPESRPPQALPPQARQPQVPRRVTSPEYDDDEVIGLPQVSAWLQRHQVILIGLGLILIELIWKSRFLHYFYFRQDDFHFTELALQYGLSWKYLGYVGSGHLHPGVLLLVWVLAKAAPYNWAAATWMTLALIAIASLACLRMLRTLLGNRLAVLIPLTLFLVTPLTLPDDSWWSSAIESLPLQITIFLAVTSHAHYVRSGRFRHALAAACWLIVGLFFFEKAIAIPVVLFAVTAGFLIDDRIVASVRRSLTRFWRAWALYAVILAAYLGLLLHSLQHSTVKPKPTSISTMVTFSWSLIRQTLLPGLLGGPWGWGQWPNAAVAYTQPTSSLVWLSVFATCAIIIVSVAIRSRAWRAWAVLVFWVLIADVVPLLLGRLATAGFAQFLGLDTRYVADAAPAAALTVALAFWPVVRDEVRAAPSVSGRPQDLFVGPAWRVVGLAVTAVVVVGSFFSANRYEKATVLYDYAGNVYLARVKSALADVPPGTVIMDQPMPSIVEWSIFYGSYSMQSRALAPMESSTTASQVRWATHFGGTIDRLMMFDSRGNLRYALIQNGVRAVPPGGKGCAAIRRGVATLRFPQPSLPTTGVIRIGYLVAPAEDGEVVTVRYGGAALPLTLHKGLHAAYFSVSGAAAEVTVIAPRSTGLCIGDVEAGNLTPAGL